MTSNIYSEEVLLKSTKYTEQLKKYDIGFSSNEHGLFAVSDGKIKTGIIWCESKTYDLDLKRVVRIKDGDYHLGILFAEYVVNNESKDADVFTVLATKASDVELLKNILGKPIETADFLCFKKVL